MENNSHEQAHRQNTTKIGNYANYAPSNASASISGHINSGPTFVGNIIGGAVAGELGTAITSWTNTSGPVADWYYTINTSTDMRMSPGATRIINPEIDGLKETVAELKREITEMKEKLKTTNNESHEEHRKLAV